MSTNFSTRLASMPRIIAGPILRKVTSKSICVFIAFQQDIAFDSGLSADRVRMVYLQVYDCYSSSSKTLVAENYSIANRIGDKLKVAYLTIEDDNLFQRGKVYHYDIKFVFGDSSTKTLEDAGILTSAGGLEPVSLKTHSTLSTSSTILKSELPSFSLPPTDLNDLRIVHGSCRKPHGESVDALASVHHLLETCLFDEASSISEFAQKRPHHLLLSGDQIYADDVSDVLLTLLQEAASTLFGYNEVLPGSLTADQLKPGNRATIALDHSELQLSKKDANHYQKSQLYYLVEYMSMYLFVWSDLLWPANTDDWPTFEDIHPDKDPDSISAPTEEEFSDQIFNLTDEELDRFYDKEDLTKFKKEFDDQTKRLKLFHATLGKVRTVMANIPTMMIFDDHDVTDDWFINGDWIRRVLGNDLGKRMVTNGLSAFGLFQGIGNNPESLLKSGQPGSVLLACLGNYGTTGLEATYQERLEETVLPVIDGSELSHASGGFPYHFQYTEPDLPYEIVAIDSRTLRGFSTSESGPLSLVSENGLQRQVEELKDDFGGDVSIWVLATPLFGFFALEEVQRRFTSTAEKVQTADVESWSIHQDGLQRMMAYMALRADNLGNLAHRYVVLSGDVHYGFAAKTNYKAFTVMDNQMETEETGPIDLTIAQLTASPFKNETSPTRLFSYSGIPMLTVTGPKMGFYPLTMHGWNTKGASSFSIGEIQDEHGALLEVWDIKDPRYESGVVHDVFDRTEDGLQHPKIDTEDSRFRKLSKSPDWSYYMEYQFGGSAVLTSDATVNETLGTNIIEMLGTAVDQGQNNMNFQNEAYGQGLVGHNNFADISFEWGSSKSVTQKLWWRRRKVFTREFTDSDIEIDDLQDPEPHSEFKVELSISPSSIPSFSTD